jgi:hypothetical protein
MMLPALAMTCSTTCGFTASPWRYKAVGRNGAVDNGAEQGVPVDQRLIAADAGGALHQRHAGAELRDKGLVGEGRDEIGKGRDHDGLWTGKIAHAKVCNKPAALLLRPALPLN